MTHLLQTAPLGQDGPDAAPRLAGADQPRHRSFGLAGRRLDGAGTVVQVEIAREPFRRLLEFRLDDGVERPALVLAPPLSGHFPFLLRDLVVELLPDFRMLVLDWCNPRHVPVGFGDFGLDAQIDAVLHLMRVAGPGAGCVGVCQGGVAALAACALLAAQDEPATPAALALIAAPIDAAARPTRIARMLAASSDAWFRDVAARDVDAAHAGRGRRVYPAALQLASFNAFLFRDAVTGGEMARKLLRDDGVDPRRFPFLDLYTSVMDLDLEFVVQNTAAVFRRRDLAEGRMTWRGARVEPSALRRTRLITVEGDLDQVAAPGQTEAAHRLCSGLPEARRRRLRFRGCGHFSLFHGRSCRDRVAPALRGALLSAGS